MSYLRSVLVSFVKRKALEEGRWVWLWRRIGRPSLNEWAIYLSRHGGFHSFGSNNAMNLSNYFGNPKYISIGSNVRIAGAFLSGHDGSVNMINRAFDKKLDNVGSIEIGDNVFIGYGSIVLPNVKIGDNTIVASGSVVSRDIEGNCVAAGVPARKVSDLDTYVARLEERNSHFPWRHLIEQRKGDFDPEMESQLSAMRVAYFFKQEEAQPRGDQGLQ